MMRSPAAVVEHVFSAVAARRYEDVAPHVDADDLARFHADTLSSARFRTTRPPQTAADHLRHDPGLPPEVAEYFARQGADHAARLASELEEEFPGVRSAEEIERISPAELLHRWLEGQDPVRRIEQQLKAQGRAVPDLRELPAVQRTVIGTVYEGEDVAHVVYRFRWVEGDEGTIRTATLHRLPDGWKMRFSHDFLGQDGWVVHTVPDEGEDPEPPP